MPAVLDCMKRPWKRRGFKRVLDKEMWWMQLVSLKNNWSKQLWYR